MADLEALGRNKMYMSYNGSRILLMQALKEMHALYFIRNNTIEIVTDNGSIFITR